MKTTIFSTILLASVLGLFHEPEAEAGLTICNKFSRRVSIALGYWDGKDQVTEGWWPTDPGACVVVVGGSLLQEYYYIHADDFAPTPTRWGDRYWFCVNNERFKIFGNQNCLARGYRSAKFFRIETNGRTEIVHNLVPPAETNPYWSTWFDQRRRLRWRDHALSYDATLRFHGAEIFLDTDLYDRGTNRWLARHSSKATFATQAGSGFSLVASFPVAGDSVTPTAHTHTVNLIYSTRADGSTKIENCPRTGECYPVEATYY